MRKRFVVWGEEQSARDKVIRRHASFEDVVLDFSLPTTRLLSAPEYLRPRVKPIDPPPPCRTIRRDVIALIAGVDTGRGDLYVVVHLEATAKWLASAISAQRIIGDSEVARAK